MGEIADMMLSGVLCEGCGEYLGEDGSSVPVYCGTCAFFAKEETGVRPTTRCVPEVRKKKKSHEPR